MVCLPDPGDTIEWKISGIPRALYKVSFDVRTGSRAPGTDFAKSYRACVTGAAATTLTLDAAARPVETFRAKGYSMFYGDLVASPHVNIGPGDRIGIRCRRAHAFVGKLVLQQVGEVRDGRSVPCTHVASPPGRDASAWPAPALVLAERRQVVIGVADRFASTSESDSWHGVDDLSAQAHVAWTDAGLHVLVRVRDDAHRVHAAKQGPWNGDGLEVFIDGREPSAVGTHALGNGVFQICCPAPSKDEVQPIQPAMRCPEGTRAWGARTKDGYRVLLSVPWAALGAGWPRAGRALGFDIAVDDADNTGGPRALRKAQIVWKGTANNYQDPSAYGRLTLQP